MRVLVAVALLASCGEVELARITPPPRVAPSSEGIYREPSNVLEIEVNDCSQLKISDVRFLQPEGSLTDAERETALHVVSMMGGGCRVRAWSIARPLMFVLSVENAGGRIVKEFCIRD